MNPVFIFFIGVGILGLFLWYFATESSHRKRWIGTFLALILTLAAALEISPIKEKLKAGIDLKGGNFFTLKLVPPEGRELSLTAQDQVIGVLEKRLNALGTADVRISKQGKDRVNVTIPVIDSEENSEQETAKIIDILKKTAKLDFRLLHPQSASLAPLVATGEERVPGWEFKNYIEKNKDGSTKSIEPVLVHKRIDMEGTHVKNARAAYTERGWVVLLQFDGEGSKKFFELTSQHDEERLGIILDEIVVSAPRINGAISGNVEISGAFSEFEARSLASALENPLEVPLEIEEQRTQPADLGKAAIQQGVYAGIAGLALTLFFVIIYYRLAGLIALIGLSVNIILLFGLMAMFQFSFTLPGIAGIILTIGIAVDANVLIYERLREEMQAGKSLWAAVQAAYDKAFSAIFDANITTLITAIILFWKASGTVKGFAVTLTIGILSSMFAALLVTRICFSWFTEKSNLSRFNFWNLVPKKKFLLMEKRHAAFVISVLLILLSVGTLITKQDRSLGVDFTGGDLITFQPPAEVTEIDIRKALTTIELEKTPTVQRQSSSTGDYIRIRSDFDTADKVVDALKAHVPALQDVETQKDRVGSYIGKEMMTTSIIALMIGLFGILIYVTFRFEFSFALGAIIALIHDILITIGITVLCGSELSLIHVGAILTIAGYSINDTIVVFDRIREGLKSRRGDVKDIMNFSINATLGRTLLTSLTTLLTIVTLYIFGGPALRDFSFTIIIGVLIGTYSSVFVASPLVLWWSRIRKSNLRREILDAEQASVNSPAAQ